MHPPPPPHGGTCNISKTYIGGVGYVIHLELLYTPYPFHSG